MDVCRELAVDDTAGWLAEAERLGVEVPPLLREPPPRKVNRAFEERRAWQVTLAAAFLVVAAYLSGMPNRGLAILTSSGLVASAWVVTREFLRAAAYLRLVEGHIICAEVLSCCDSSLWPYGDAVMRCELTVVIHVDGVRRTVRGHAELAQLEFLMPDIPAHVLVVVPRNSRDGTAGGELLSANQYAHAYPGSLY